jgi:chromosome segregation ATPase
VLYGLGGLGLLSLILGFLLWQSNGKVDELNRELGASRTNTETAVHANGTLKASLQECREINEQNTSQKESALHKAELAEVRVRELEALLQESINDFDDTKFRDNTTCRTLAEPLPSDFVERLCIAEAANCSQ